MKLKNYENMNSIQLENYMGELLKSGFITNKQQKAEMQKLYNQLKEQNLKSMINIAKNEILK